MSSVLRKRLSEIAPISKYSQASWMWDDQYRRVWCSSSSSAITIREWRGLRFDLSDISRDIVSGKALRVTVRLIEGLLPNFVPCSLLMLSPVKLQRVNQIDFCNPVAGDWPVVCGQPPSITRARAALYFSVNRGGIIWITNNAIIHNIIEIFTYVVSGDKENIRHHQSRVVLWIFNF